MGEIQAGMAITQGIQGFGRTEEERQRSEEYYRSLFEMAPDVIYSISADGILTALSPAFEVVTGWPVAEWLGKEFAGIVHPDDLPLAKEKFQQTLRGETPAPYELRILAKSGEHLVGEFRTKPLIDNGKVVGKIGVARDITERKRVENALRFLAEASAELSSSLDYQTTLANVAKLAVPKIADWCVVDVVEEDESVQRLAVAHIDPAKEELAHEMRRRYPDEPRVVRAREPRIYPEISDEQLVRRARDPEHLALLRSLGFRSAMLLPLVARGRVLGAITLVSAESGHRYGPEDLAVAEELAQRAAVAVDNARLYHQAQEALGMRNEFLSIASHELKTPLTALVLQMRMLDRVIQNVPLEGPAVERAARAIEGAERQVKRLAKLTNDLLDVSRIAAGRLELDRDEMDLAALVREVALRFQNEQTAGGSEISIGADPPVTGCWDRFRLDQVITNLLSNAIKYGGGKPVQIEVGADDDMARIAVRDQGMGIAPEDLSRIFDRFERATPTKSQSGLGLGLYICRRLVEAHGGTIKVSSQVGEGSTFTVEFPLTGS